MSRLPQPNLKRKAVDDLDGPGTSKLPALGSSTSQPTRPTRTLAGKGHPPALTVPRAPLLQTTNITTTRPGAKQRAVSAPPKSSGPVRGPQRVPAATSKAAPPTKGSSSLQPVQEDGRWIEVQEQLHGMQAAQKNDRETLRAEMAAERAKREELERFHRTLEQDLVTARSLEQESRRAVNVASDELDRLKKKHASELMDFELAQTRLERENRQLKDDVRVLEDDLRREKDTTRSLKETISQQSTAHVTLTAQITALQSQSGAVVNELDAVRAHAADLLSQLQKEKARADELEHDLLEAETLRRKLHNMVQELKGNIRVFCRVRPALPSDGSPSNTGVEVASIAYPDKRDHKEIVLSSSSESAMGAERKETWQFSFDRVFEPHSSQADVFEEISQLAQSCVDGYNVCIFAYGQTGSGKSFTMEGGASREMQGMIPRAVEQVFRTSEHLRSKGWEYKLEGQFVEIYNETINDLLGSGEFDKKKHDIKHDKGSTRITDVVVVPLNSPAQVASLLSLAQSRRSVAATLMNERSSRSHSVFTLRISGSNAMTGETCDGALNLVDLAGSERLNASGAGSDKERLRETQSINKSLSALGDVIAALGAGGASGEKGHIPYRNSKLTYLLQNSLSGNSKTLMLLNLSPLAAHLNESLCSLRFATKVNNTTLGTAKRQIKSS
ncbi:kinesin-domain-containing protein [Exidia glandulosa HHB12029]|uniref:Kinesin-domain-containing protein n=1 Tax=Exidia glandulosa HHB12029 TaxID=1314781 RepID=A0A165M551_EXIGL|nr:kinesin-domain-containing protein [Exidia glandulosa HHB12029]